MAFDAAKLLDRVTITVYQTAAGNVVLTSLISALGDAIHFPHLADRHPRRNFGLAGSDTRFAQNLRVLVVP